MGQYMEKFSKVIGVDEKQVWQISNGLNAWFSIDLKEGLSFLPTRYSIRHRSDFNETALRYWTLFGKKNREWVIIKTHSNDTSIKSVALSTFTWELECDDYYTGFKILQFGHSSETGNYNHFNLSNIEFYGFLIGL